MSLKLRLARAGTKKRPYYHIVVADARCPRDGRFIEKIGTYDPMLADDSKRVTLDAERATHWLGVGAQPTDRVLRFLDAAGLLKRAAAQQPRARQAGQEGHRARRSPRQGRCRQGRRCRRAGRSSGRRVRMADASPKQLLMGRIGAAHGIKGEVRIQSFTEEPLALADYGPLAPTARAS